MDQEDQKAATIWRREGLRIFQKIGDKPGIASSLKGLGIRAHLKGVLASAKTMLAESLRCFHELGNKSGQVLRWRCTK